MIKFKNITKIYHTGKIEFAALKNISFEISEGEFVAIMGPSGSGKSTLLNIMGCLDVATSGQYFINKNDVSGLNFSQLAKIRNSEIGFVFQNFNLLSYLTATNNIELPLIYSGNKYSHDYLLKTLGRVGLKEWAGHKPTELSGGQQQRVAMARALVNNPSIILADEPTGNLDSKSGLEIIKLLEKLNNEGITIIIITHDDYVASFSHRIIHIKDGEIFSDTKSKKIRKISKAPVEKVIQKKKGLELKKVKQNVTVAIKSIITKKMRTFLTTLGMLIGVASVVAMISLGEGAKQRITEDIKKMGSNLLTLHSGGQSRGGMRSQSFADRNKLSIRDADSVKTSTKLIKAMTPVSRSSATVVYRNRNVRTDIQGVNASFPEINNFSIKYGTFFTEKDIRLQTRVAVLGNTVFSNLFDGKDPVGTYIKLNRINFLVIGVLEPKGSSMFGDMDDLVAIPVTTAMKKLFGTDKIYGMTFQVKNEQLMTEAEEEITRILKREHNLGEDEEADFHIHSQLEMIEQVQETTRVFTLLLGGIASISLLVGGIGIMNIMLVTVMERIKEIGLRKAVGAQRKDILYQFLTEALIICFIGGVFGILLGFFGSKIISKFTDWVTFVPFYSIIISVLSPYTILIPLS